jgi:hypothetical protein
VSAVNAEGTTLPAHLRHIRERAHDIAHYGIRQGTAATLASTQTHFGYDLHRLRPSVHFDQDMEEPLVKSFQEEAYMISLSVDPEKVVQKIFNPSNASPF